MVMSVRWVESCHRQSGFFRDRVDQGAEPFIRLLFVFKVEGLDSDFVVDLFDAGFTLRIFATVIFLRHKKDSVSPGVWEQQGCR